MRSKLRFAAVLLLSVAVLPGGAGAITDAANPSDVTAALEAADALAPEVAGAAGVRDELAAFAGTFGVGDPLAEQLARASELAVGAIPARSVGPADFDAAFAALYRAAGVEAALGARPPAPIATAVAPLVAAVARAGELTERAFARVTPAERAFLLRHVDELEVPLPHRARWRRLDAIGERVDVELIHRGSALIAAAIDALPADLGELEKSWVDPSGMVEIGSSSFDFFGTERVLIVDLGGGDFYSNNTAAVGPGSTLPLPVSVVADLAGNDAYVEFGFNPAAGQNYQWTQGVGLGGIGVLADRWGNDYYVAYGGPSLFPNQGNQDCKPDAAFGVAYRQVVFAQGTGAFGVGVLADASGSDWYEVTSATQSPTNCHFVKAYAFTQGTGLHRGLGALIDDLGSDYRSASTQSYGYPGFPNAQDFIAGTYAQGAAAGGVGLLVDKEGDDYNTSQAYARANFVNANKGSFATVFSQGAVMGLTEDWSSPPRTQAPVGLALPSACAPGTGGGDGQGRHGACAGAGIGIMIDAVGDDYFDSGATAVQGQGGQAQCTLASHALTASQGAAGWGGLAAMVNLDAGHDTFQLRPSASGGPCPFDHTQAYAVGQGFGGAVHYPVWDDPEGRWMAGSDQMSVSLFAPHPAGSTGAYLQVRPAAPAVGVLVSGGGPCPVVPDGGGNISCDQSLDVIGSRDSYYASPSAQSQGGGAIAESWVQGSAAAPRPGTLSGFIFDSATGQFQQVNRLDPTGVGIGVHVDAGGADSYVSNPYADGSPPITRAVSVAQGATVDGLAALLNIGGSDHYQSAASAIGGPATSRGTGSAELAGTPIQRPTALFADIFGYERYVWPAACKGDGSLLAPVVWGDPATCAANAGALTIGLDLASELPL